MWSALTPLSPESSLEPVPTRLFLYTKDGTLCPQCWGSHVATACSPSNSGPRSQPTLNPLLPPCLAHPHPSFFRPILPALSAPPSPLSCSQTLRPDSSFLWAPCLPAASPHCHPITTYLDSLPWSPAPILTDQVVSEPVTPAGFTPLCSQPLPPVALTLLGVKTHVSPWDPWAPSGPISLSTSAPPLPPSPCHYSLSVMLASLLVVLQRA